MRSWVCKGEVNYMGIYPNDSPVTVDIQLCTVNTISFLFNLECISTLSTP